jgi:hypothetical protein
MNCVVLPDVLGLEMSDGIPEFVEGKHDTYVMYVYVKFFIKEF